MAVRKKPLVWGADGRPEELAPPDYLDALLPISGVSCGVPKKPLVWSDDGRPEELAPPDYLDALLPISGVSCGGCGGCGGCGVWTGDIDGGWPESSFQAIDGGPP